MPVVLESSEMDGGNNGGRCVLLVERVVAVDERGKPFLCPMKFSVMCNSVWEMESGVATAVVV